ncbi:MAG: glycine zipper 2TM domain-containing protein [Gallionella sp.]
MNTYLNLTALGLAALLCISSITACSQKPSSEEVAAQVKIAMDQAEKDKQAAAAQVAQPPQNTPAPAAAPAEPAAQQPAKKHVAAKHKPAVHQQVQAMQAVESAKPVCANCGFVLAVNVIEVEGKGSGVGVVAGGVVGGLVGNQVGQGSGRDLATFAGVVGGALAGNTIEKKSKKTRNYDIRVKMDDGSEHTYRQATDPGLVNGQKVKIEKDVVVKD